MGEAESYRDVGDRDVLDPDSAEPAALKERLGDLGVLVDLVSYALGRTDDPPAVGDSDAELAALVLSAQAGAALDRGDRAAALRLINQAAHVAQAYAPPLAGLLLGSAAGVHKEHEGASHDVVATLRRAQTLLDATDLRVGRAEIHLNTGLTLQELATGNPGLLADAVRHYQRALRLVESVEAPGLWAAAHANLASAYLTMPMTEASDQLRLGIAVQSLRKALTIYTAAETPVEWASAQLNLANALVYAPSAKQGDNLVEAVELYEAVLVVRDRETDPLGRARVLANQGNALAHLGVFDHAKAKLYEARYLFEELGDGESVRAVRGVLDEVARQTALARSAPAEQEPAEKETP